MVFALGADVQVLFNLFTKNRRTATIATKPKAFRHSAFWAFDGGLG